MRIAQVRVSSHLRSFRAAFMAKYSLKRCSDVTRPSVFFGCYPSGLDIRHVMKHKALAVIVWGGTDACQLTSPRYHELLTTSHVRHVAISQSISKDLLALGIPHISLPVSPVSVASFSPAPIGSCVYVYGSHTQPSPYNESLVSKVMTHLPDVKFLRGYARAPNSYKRARMPRVYAKCFMGLRLTEHDGLSNTVIELGLMGRRCIWNESFPTAISWSGIRDIVRSIRKEQSKLLRLTLPQLQRRADNVRRYLRLPVNWLTTEFYG